MRRFFCHPAVRAVVFALAIAGGVGGACFLYRFEGRMPCLQYLLTHTYCAGCGSGRSARALLHLNLRAAWGYNKLFVLALPVCLYGVASYFFRYVFGRNVLPLPRVRRWQAITLCVVIVLYTVARNIPVYPFTLLAPHTV